MRLSKSRGDFPVLHPRPSFGLTSFLRFLSLSGGHVVKNGLATLTPSLPMIIERTIAIPCARKREDAYAAHKLAEIIHTSGIQSLAYTSDQEASRRALLQNSAGKTGPVRHASVSGA